MKDPETLVDDPGISETRAGGSFRDPSGFLFTCDGVLYRQVNTSYKSDYDHFIQSGLYQHLTKNQLLVSHQEVELRPAVPEIAYKVICPERIPFISYPYEWCFQALKDATLLTLRIQKISLKHGMSLKDCSAYNIQFFKGKPIFIDTLSFEKYPAGKPWDAYRQFCQHFLAPLALMAYTDIRLSQLLRNYIDGLPLDLASRLLPTRTRLVLALAIHIHIHAASQKRFSDNKIHPPKPNFSLSSMSGLVESLESAVKRLEWKSKRTPWEDYYDHTNYSADGLEKKKELIGKYLDAIQPKQVWDLGSNTGVFSRIASKRGISVIAMDIDPGAVESAYLESKKQNDRNIVHLIMDLTNPSPGLGWQNEERSSLLDRKPTEAVFALALIHHLAISNNIPMDKLAAFFASLSKWLVIEFIPKEDSQAQKLLTFRKDIFPEYTREGFEEAFKHWFKIHQSDPIEGAQRILYLMENISPIF